MLHWIKRIGSTLLALAFTLTTGTAYAQGTIKVMYTDPLSGPFAQVGDQNLQQFKYIIDYINGRGGALGKKFELVSFDNKSQPSEALLALKSATDQNIPVIMQCSGSNIAAALIEGVDKHNERNPTNRIVYVNCGAVATELSQHNRPEIREQIAKMFQDVTPLSAEDIARSVLYAIGQPANVSINEVLVRPTDQE